MFAPAGWISLKDVYRYFNLYFSENERFGEYIFTGDEAYEFTWQFAEEAESVAVCHPSGAILYVSREMLDCVNECSHENYHVNVHYGTVGSGEVWAETKLPDGIREIDTYLNLLYGPFRGLPIIFERADFEGFLERMYPDFSEGNIDDEDDDNDKAFVLRTGQGSGQASGSPEFQDMSPRAVSSRILSAWRSNRTMVQAEIKALVAPAQSHRQFLLAWALAAQEEPMIKSPGRRKRDS